MKDWKAIAKAHGLELGPEEAERLAGALGALERALDPLTRDLPFDLEPSLTFHIDGEDEA